MIIFNSYVKLPEGSPDVVNEVLFPIFGLSRQLEYNGASTQYIVVI